MMQIMSSFPQTNFLPNASPRKPGGGLLACNGRYLTPRSRSLEEAVGSGHSSIFGMLESLPRDVFRRADLFIVSDRGHQVGTRVSSITKVSGLLMDRTH
jgi:hypothetical protein